MAQSVVTIAEGQKLWTYFDGYQAMVYALAESKQVSIFRCKADDEEPIRAKLINIERMDDTGSGMFVLKEFPNTDSGWLTAQAWVVSMLDTLGAMDLDEVTTARIKARLVVNT